MSPEASLSMCPKLQPDAQSLEIMVGESLLPVHVQQRMTLPCCMRSSTTALCLLMMTIQLLAPPVRLT
jgi:hypothetical protein